MSELTVHLETVTPLFLGGAEPTKSAELRPPSVKGALRFWYRALDRGYETGQEKAFGSTNPSLGQAPILLRVAAPQTGAKGWSAPDPAPPVKNRSGVDIRGAAYLGYSLNLRNNQTRCAIAENTVLKLEAIEHAARQVDQAMRRAWVAACWCLAHLGGLGSRAHRGLGSLRITKLEGWQEADDLVIPSATDPATWMRELEAGFATLREWYPQRPEADHPVLDGRARVLLLTDPCGSWDEALNVAGGIMQDYRLRRPPDYAAIEQYLFQRVALTSAPVRAAFGLPLTFRMRRPVNGKPRTRSVTFEGANSSHRRQPSLLSIRMARIGQGYHPMLVLMNGPFLAPGDRIRARPVNDDERKEESKAVEANPSLGPILKLPQPQSNLPTPPGALSTLEAFVDHVKEQKSYLEVRPWPVA